MTLFCALMLLAPLSNVTAQDTYTLGTGALGYNTLGVTPYSTSNLNSRSQYVYLAEEMLDQGASSGNIISFAMKITDLALPSTIRPENIQVKMGPTAEVVLPETLIENLPVYYTATMLPIDQTGWFTITLNSPYEWDGQRNIVLEICRTNTFIGTSFSVESTVFNQMDFRSSGLYNNDTASTGCNLTGDTPMIQSVRRTRPNIQFTMTNPCGGTPIAGGTTVAPSNTSCDGTPFTLTVINGATESGLGYSWEKSTSASGPWTPIVGAVNTTYTATQTATTWYRRATLCLAAGNGIYSSEIEVGGTGCLSTNDYALSNLNIIAYSFENGLKVESKNTSLNSVSVYDISGRLVARKQDINKQQVAIPLTMKGQVVVVKITTDEGVVVNKKVILN